MNTSVDSIWHRENWARDRSGPLYLQLRQHIENAILSGQLNAGEPLPSEREIAIIGDVSRVTVRKAVTELAQKGFVVQKRGSGTTVAPPEEKLQQSLSRLTSFSEDMSRRGQNVSSTPFGTRLVFAFSARNPYPWTARRQSCCAHLPAAAC